MSISSLHFRPVESPPFIRTLKRSWLNSLTAPQDGMWESFMDMAQHWQIEMQGGKRGYACVNEAQQLIQFFLLPACLNDGASTLASFVERMNISEGMVGTNNPVYLSLAMELQTSVEVHSHFFTETIEPGLIPEVKAVLRQAATEDLETLIAWYHRSIGASTEWLKGYLGDLLQKQEVYMLEGKGELLGATEVRSSQSNPHVADVGMVVSPDHRRMGLGTFLINSAKEIAIEKGMQPICSTEKENIGSLKAIRNAGFRSFHRLLKVLF